MKQIVLAAMVMMTMAGSASAEVTAWDYFWGTAIPHTFEDLVSTLDPATSGWNDFWYQCQDPNKTAGDCVGTVAAGVGMVIAAPIVALSATNVVGLWGVMATTGSPAVLASPVGIGVFTGGVLM